MDEIESRVYCCFKCRSIIAYQDDIVSKLFQAGHRKRGFLFSRAMNLEEDTPADQAMMTGPHLVSRVSCKDCGEELGWKYHKAYHASNEYKVGKTVLEISKIDKLINPPFR